MRILIIEDDPDLQKTLVAYLRSACFAVDSALSGSRGLYFALTNDYDVIILDYGLPEKNGLEVCQEIRRHGKTVPILILSIQSEIITKVELLNHGADDYLTKPFSFDELLARLQALLRRPALAQTLNLQVGDINIDVSRQVVTVNGKEVYLTRKEFCLLEYMARNCGKVVSRGMIMEHVWDMDGDLFSNTIEAHIRNLRRKLGASRFMNLIVTVPGRGYRLEARR